ncbi:MULTISPECIES: peptidoglycan-binding protein [unclassified Streptomyces]|uniref:peptidoglycan-binding domain-containing protein n=1 Tax=unclassified Streptomyces TaxID=2593676 RepID=UPI0005A5F55E|nr:MULTISPECIES: peptidoglycan-binding domain-containing protein [unclassified Streptomyces]ODA70855.1 putative peptidoglycan binding domain protein [Streptomyces sp. AVP053U2]WAX78652.1 peptidoglycan-binding domain-containing protein [Streptomyces sp. KMM 9044]
MRAMTKALVSVTTAVGIAAGGLATAGTSFAAPAQDTKAVASAEAVAPLAVVNLGLSTAEAKKVQDWLRTYWGYTGARDGQLGTNSWKAFQRGLRAYWGYNDAIDGIVGPNTVKALQRLLKAHWGYTGAIDGIAGSGTQAAFKRFANANSS